MRCTAVTGLSMYAFSLAMIGLLSAASAQNQDASQGFAAAVVVSPKTREELEATMQEYQDRAFPAVNKKWGRRFVSPVTIPVCWEAASMIKSYDRGRKIVEAAVTEQWENNSLVDFSGWKQCLSDSAKGIHILVVDDKDNSPHTKGLGTSLNAKPNGMVLNFTFAQWNQGCLRDVDRCIRIIAVHEFGHALFFAHEHKRPDTPGECNAAPVGSNGTDSTLTPWDWHSVMNYCNPIYGNEGVLSSWDKYSLQHYYGKRS